MSSVSETVSLKPSDFTNIVYSEGIYFKNCSNLVTEEMISECCNDRSLIEQSAILEGAKLDLTLKNFIKEGPDYRSLKADLNDVIKANDISDEALRNNGRKLLRTCKRILQCIYDISSAIILPIGISNDIARNASMIATPNFKITKGFTSNIIYSIIGYIVSFIINRLLRLLIDTIEFNSIKEDAKDIVRELRLNAKKTDDPKLAKKMESEADRLEESIIKYTKKK